MRCVKELGSFYEQREIGGEKPYVVSEDIQIVLKKWAENRGFVLPDQGYFNTLRSRFSEAFRYVFPSFELVSEKTLTDGLSSLVAGTNLLPVSLDRVYFPAENGIDITRYVDTYGENKGLGRRSGSETLRQQFERIRANGIKEVALVDDVVFSGDLLIRVSKVLEVCGIQTPVVCAAITVSEGVDKLQATGKTVYAVKTYDSVIDEVCERDFYPGVPLSGRTFASDISYGVPYIYPFGKPTNWASIPEYAATLLSTFCLQQTIGLFESIEESSGRVVTVGDLDRRVVTIAQEQNRFVDELRKYV